MQLYNKKKIADEPVIQANDVNKPFAITKSDISTLEELIKGGPQSIGQRTNDAFLLLQKLQQVVDITPYGAKRKKQTKAHSKTNDQQSMTEITDIAKTNLLSSEDHMLNNVDQHFFEDDTNASKLPCKYRVVINPGALVKKGEDIKSTEVGKLPQGSVVIVEEISGRRARLSSPIEGWCSMFAQDNRIILQKETTKSKEMDDAIAAERARKTKILILKSITTLNDGTVTRILEKTEWNLRHALEAFYIAKLKTQEYLKQQQLKQEQNVLSSTSSTSPSNVDAIISPLLLNDTKQNTDNNNNNVNNNNRSRKSKGWWKSWKTYASEN